MKIINASYFNSVSSSFIFCWDNFYFDLFYLFYRMREQVWVYWHIITCLYADLFASKYILNTVTITWTHIKMAKPYQNKSPDIWPSTAEAALPLTGLCISHCHPSTHGDSSQCLIQKDKVRVINHAHCTFYYHPSIYEVSTQYLEKSWRSALHFSSLPYN